MGIVELNAKSGTTKILMADSFERLVELIGEERLIVITDRNVGRLYEDRLKAYDRIEIGTGEKAKTLDTVRTIYEKFLDHKVDKSFFVVGVGGGIVTDVTGFTASTYMRGIRFGFVPTTFLAQVDASIGGKNGVNLKGLKNMIGTIRQPEFCLIDFSFLKTLSREQIISGMAEVVKSGAISDRRLFEYVEGHHREIVSLDEQKLERAVASTISVKVNFVERDETENWERMKLNFGHTIGHAVEKVAKIPHGYAIGIGMIAAANLSTARGLLPSEESERIKTLLSNIGLPTGIEADCDEVFEGISMDKKSLGNSINMVLLSRIGSATIVKIRKEELKRTLQEVCI